MAKKSMEALVIASKAKGVLKKASCNTAGDASRAKRTDKRGSVASALSLTPSSATRTRPGALHPAAQGIEQAPGLQCRAA